METGPAMPKEEVYEELENEWAENTECFQEKQKTEDFFRDWYSRKSQQSSSTFADIPKKIVISPLCLHS